MASKINNWDSLMLETSGTIELIMLERNNFWWGQILGCSSLMTYEDLNELVTNKNEL